MIDLKTLHREVIDNDWKNTLGGRLPIKAKQSNAPIIAMNRWVYKDGSLVKRYEFRREEDREKFVSSMMQYERITKHYASLLVKKDSVVVSVTTEGLGHITELDKEYAAHADVVFKDIVYSVD